MDVTTIDAGKVTQIGAPKWKNNTPAVYEPIPNNAAWPKET
jgi:hypothetical protein